MAVTAARLPAQARLAFQPVVVLRDLAVFGYEALLRGVPDPAAFFAGAALEGWAQEADAEVCRMAAAALPLLPESAVLFVNVTPQSFLAGDGVLEALRKAGQGRVVAEVTEQAFRAAPGEMAAAARKWRKAGVRLAVDDVGSGQSRLLVLAEVEPEFVKADRALVERAARSGAARAVLRHVAALAWELGAALVAEGVETEKELQMARSTGADFAQGFLLGRPRPLPAGARGGCGEMTHLGKVGP